MRAIVQGYFRVQKIVLNNVFVFLGECCSWKTSQNLFCFLIRRSIIVWLPCVKQAVRTPKQLLTVEL